MSTIFFNILGLAFIALIVWWFLIAKTKAVKTTGNMIDVTVQDGVYSPAVIKAKQGEELVIRFFRKDDTPCSEVVVFDDFNVSAKLPHEQYKSVKLQLNQTGEFEFTCQMGMYRGKLIVE